MEAPPWPSSPWENLHGRRRVEAREANTRRARCGPERSEGCRGGRRGIYIRDGEVLELGDDGVRTGLGTSTANPRDVPRFRALVMR